MKEIPFSRFQGNVRQLETSFALPAMGRYFDICFSHFKRMDEKYAALKQQGIARLVSAAGVEPIFGFRPRRFSGGPGLPPGRYFTLCGDDNFDDCGTLRDELTAYYSGEAGVTARIWDPNVDEGVLEYLRRHHGFSEDSLAHPLYLISYKIERETEENKILLDEMALKIGEGVDITYGVRQIKIDFDKVA